MTVSEVASLSTKLLHLQAFCFFVSGPKPEREVDPNADSEAHNEVNKNFK